MTPEQVLNTIENLKLIVGWDNQLGFVVYDSWVLASRDVQSDSGHGNEIGCGSTVVEAVTNAIEHMETKKGSSD